jgi:LDH2 family malate/lactate/ureidoglycolate dehydrogenase
MEKLWVVFWKGFGISLLLTVMAGIIIGFISRSVEVTYRVVQGAIVVGLGVCGLIGFVVVPGELFFQDRAKGRGAGDAIE